MSLLFNDRELSPLNVYREAEIIERTIETEITLDVPNIPSNDTYTATVTFNEASVGDYIQIVPPYALIESGLMVGIPVATAENTVKFNIHNHSGSSVNPASGVYKLKTIKYGNF